MGLQQCRWTKTLVTAAVDLSGRPFLVWSADVPNESLGTFHSSLAEEFWRAASSAGAFNLHVILHHGKNTHHIIEAIFKAIARALRTATELDPAGERDTVRRRAFCSHRRSRPHVDAFAPWT